MLDHFRVVKVGDGQLPLGQIVERRRARRRRTRRPGARRGKRPGRSRAVRLLPLGVGRGEVHHRPGQRRASTKNGIFVHDRVIARAGGDFVSIEREKSTSWTSRRSSSSPWPPRSFRSSRTTTPTAPSWARTCSARPCRCSAPTRRSSAPAWKASWPATPAPWCSASAAAWSTRRRQPHHRPRRGRGPGHRRDEGVRRRHLSAHQVPPLEPEHLHHAEAGRASRGSGCKKGQVLADGPCTEPASWPSAATSWWPSCRGAATTSRTPSWSPRSWCKEDYYTSIHIEEFEIEARDTKLGPEEITRDIPNVSESALKRPRRVRHRPHRRHGQGGRHPGRQGDAEGRDPAHSRGEAAPRHLRREGGRRPRRLAQDAAGHRGHRSSTSRSSPARASRRTFAPRRSRRTRSGGWRRTSRTRSGSSPRSATRR